jgi:hypothetical protein
VRRSDVPVVELGRARRYDPEQVRADAVAHRSHHVSVPNQGFSLNGAAFRPRPLQSVKSSVSSGLAKGAREGVMMMRPGRGLL